MDYDQCHVCKEQFESGKIKTYYIKDIKSRERISYSICDKCTEFLLNLYFEEMRIIMVLKKNKEKTG
jgi:hypothetical protein